jgi:hypothetical protein
MMLKTCTLDSFIKIDPNSFPSVSKQPDKHMREAIRHTHERITGAVEGAPKVRAKVRKT